MATEEKDEKKAGGTTAPAEDSAEKQMGRRKIASASNSGAYVLLTIGALVLLNLIGTRVFGRVDLTENHIYTLAPASKKIVASLPDYLTVKAYISKKDLPQELQPVASYLRDLLEFNHVHRAIPIENDVVDGLLEDPEMLLILEPSPHRLAVEHPIGLRPCRADRSPLRSI